ncbi:unnamed protein product [Gemmata massiliana]|uniref:Uncharacterized protein n=1 Tax=Gemmata massiliana TaxID=1210884 RepID=A0A6P2D0V3_9BACT|nr:unnamed protein product [Gemmata massiliana]
MQTVVQVLIMLGFGAVLLTMLVGLTHLLLRKIPPR